ncbi:hypothetical protein ACWT_6849 [Actinoplanes sp. SE50]|uniref:hypothetical protein n=1 Tax=unclassified Actinoplanes TaxID=2626549 RepID=UPI00023ED4F7|nr:MULTISPECIES: hypothetical protein [unclassified Actinoplanes]AEV87862.1 hypothetical protein ACPL_6980 [Actinoplanes sp. SE50/110]ATO86264.1 hypothetical protein ACWT_6849 [Actinoplanes sp. SE50]SLM03679.1 hypothetical protein ACSP50_6975 [Actinoplanes sp. SE50/110]
MSNLELIVGALAAGASAGVKDTASAVVRDAYAGFKAMLKPWVRGEARAALDADETDPQVWQARLGQELTVSGAVDDEQILAAAAALLEAVVDADRVTDSGAATATAGGHASTGIAGAAGDRAAQVTRSGEARAEGHGSVANTGVYRSPRP